MKHTRFVLLLIACLATPLAADAQGMGALFAAPKPATPATAPPPSGSAEQARQALEVLKDDTQRAKLISVLEAMSKAEGAPLAAATPATPPVIADVLADSMVGQLLVGASERLQNLSQEVVYTVRTASDFPQLWNWIQKTATDPYAQGAMLDAAWKLAVVLGLGLCAEYVVRRWLEKPAARLRKLALPRDAPQMDPEATGIADAEEGQTEWMRRRGAFMGLMRRLPYVLASYVVYLIPALAVLATGYVVISTSLLGNITSRLVVLAVLDAYVVWRVVVAAVWVVVAPDDRRLRLLPCSDEIAVYILRWTRRLALVIIIGFVAAEAGLLFGFNRVAHDAVIKLVALVAHIMLIVVVLQMRRPIAAEIRGHGERGGFVRGLRKRFAAVWHQVAIFYLVALWVVWALDVPDGFNRLVRVFVALVVVGVAAKVVSFIVQLLLDRALRSAHAMGDMYPDLEERAGRYHHLIRGLVNVLIGVVAMVALFEAWGFGTLRLFAPGQLGGQITTAVLKIGATVVVALAVWEVVNLSIQRHLARLAREAQLARSARLRTLLPMFRTTLLVSVSLIAGLMVLSEIGVNIAPLLAGAGVVGLAIGFGSQKLVQDIITGLFLLLENAMQVGDVVSLGGLSGTVENLSIRTIRLRAVDGSVHIVPFSAVTTVTNQTRDFGYAVVDVSVGLNEDTDHIGDILRDVARDMRAEPAWKTMMLADLDVMGVDRFIDTAAVLRIRVKTTPSSRWAVGRELNRRIKQQFDALAIESPITSYRALSLAIAAEAPQAALPPAPSPA